MASLSTSGLIEAAVGHLASAVLAVNDHQSCYI